MEKKKAKVAPKDEFAPQGTALDLAPVVDQTNALAVFTVKGALSPILDKIALEVRALAPDVSSATGRRDIASLAYKIAQSKTYLDGIGKDLVAEMKDLPRQIDASRKLAREYLDMLRDEIRAPLAIYEAEQAALEAVRVAVLEAEALKVQIEVDHDVALLMNDVIDLSAAQQAAAREQERIDYEARVQRDAEVFARQVAEREVLNARLAQQRAEDAAEQAIVRAANAEREAGIKLSKLAAIERLKNEALDNATRARDAERMQDRDNRVTINRLALADLMQIEGVQIEVAKAIIKAIAAQSISHITINY
jgi:colicin import membrane protein